MKLFLTHEAQAQHPNHQTLYVPQDQPIDAALGRLVWDSGETELDLLIDSGTYLTAGISLQSGALYRLDSVSITGIGQPALRLIGAETPVRYVLENTRALDSIQVTGVTADCNWPSLTSGVQQHLDGGTPWVKLGGFNFRSRGNISLNRVCVRHPGAATKSTEGRGAEVFPILLRAQPVTGEAETQIHCTNWQVQHLHTIGLGYGTAAMIVSVDNDSPLDKMIEPDRIPGHWWHAVVSGGLVEDFRPGIALGCADGQRILYTRNRICGCGTAFNSDTAHQTVNSRVEISYNEFFDCDRGIWVGAPNWGTPHWLNFFIRQNDLKLSDPTQARLVKQGACENIRWED